MNDISILSVVLSLIILSIAFRQVTLHFKLKDLFEIDLRAHRNNEEELDTEKNSKEGSEPSE